MAEIKIGSEWQAVEVVAGKLRTEPLSATCWAGFAGRVVEIDAGVAQLESEAGDRRVASVEVFRPYGLTQATDDGGWLVPVYGDDYEPEPGELIGVDGELIPAEAP